MLARRLLAIALRARLWHEYTWDTRFGWHTEQTLSKRRQILGEYLELSAADLDWSMQRWDEENLESRKDRCRQALTAARQAMQSIMDDLVIPNSLLLHRPNVEGAECPVPPPL